MVARAFQRTYTVASAAFVRATIARLGLSSPNEPDAELGDVTLQRHQINGVARLSLIIARHGGALLADEVGLGKTYTALALARRYQRIEIVAPAALRALWQEACARCDVPAHFTTSESLSRHAGPEAAADLIVVDEAHWFRNPETKRYRHLARRCRKSAVLLLSATPLHNKPADLEALLALFLGAGATQLTPNEMIRLVVRRAHTSAAVQQTQTLPRVLPTRWCRINADRRVAAALNAIEAPLPARDGGLAMALLRLTLLRRYASSDSALRVTLRRMLARALAFTDAIRGGSYPTARELCAWLVADEAIQLALPGLLASPMDGPNECLSSDVLQRHSATVRQALAALRAARDLDRRRVEFLTRLVRDAHGEPVVAFSQFDATVRALARRMPIAGVAVLSGRGGRIASGRISRSDVLRQLDATEQHAVPEAMRVRLLLTTDLLSEGVNLQRAKIIVHLDVPWTAARLEQRVGRLCRIGSPHGEVSVYGLAPPNAVAIAERAVARVRAKWGAARRRFGSSAILAADALVQPGGRRRGAGHSEDQEALRLLLESWLGARHDASSADAEPLVACLPLQKRWPRMGIALVRTPHPEIVAFGTRGPITCAPARVLRAARLLSQGDSHVAPDPSLMAHTTRRLLRCVAEARGRAALSDGKGAAGARLVAAVAQATRSLPRNERPLGLKLAAEVRDSVRHARTAGDLQLLEEIAQRSGAPAAANTAAVEWLQSTSHALAAAFGGVREATELPARCPSAIAAILLGI